MLTSSSADHDKAVSLCRWTKSRSTSCQPWKAGAQRPFPCTSRMMWSMSLAFWRANLERGCWRTPKDLGSYHTLSTSWAPGSTSISWWAQVRPTAPACLPPPPQPPSTGTRRVAGLKSFALTVLACRMMQQHESTEPHCQRDRMVSICINLPVLLSSYSYATCRQDP